MRRAQFRAALILGFVVVAIFSSTADAAPFWKKKKVVPPPPPPIPDSLVDPDEKVRALIPTHNSNGKPYGPIYYVGNQQKPMGILTMAHGLADRPTEWKPFARRLAEHFTELLIVLPGASERGTVGYNGFPPIGWYDGPNDFEAIRESAKYLHAVSRHFCGRFNLSERRVIYGGFSKGAVVALHAGLTAPETPRGIMSLSGYIADEAELKKTAINRDIPVFLGHGKEDEILPATWLKKTYDYLTTQLNFHESSLTVRLYARTNHQVSPREIADIILWLRDIIPDWMIKVQSPSGF